MGHEFTLAAGGDVCLARQMPGYTSKHGGDWPLRQVRHWLIGADIALVNLECVLTSGGQPVRKQGRRPFHYRAHPGMLEVLRVSGVKAVTTANNHAMDYGPDALLEQRALLLRHGIVPCGSGTSFVEAASPGYFDVPPAARPPDCFRAGPGPSGCGTGVR